MGVDDAVLLPVYNEEASVEVVLNSIRGFHHGELIVIDDGSTDDTAEILAEREDILVVTHPENLGYGRSLIDGFTFAHFAGIERLITMDVDGQHEPAHIPQFFEALTPELDCVSGSRYLPESTPVGVAPDDRRAVNDEMTRLVNDSTGWGITDAFCGFKAYRLQRVVELGLSEQGYALPMELWAKAFRAAWRVRELPVERIYFDHDRSFGADLDDPTKRLAYYRRVWDGALAWEPA